MRLMRRLAKAQDDLKKKGIGKEPPRGSYESHCPGGLSHGIKGEPCSEHEDCVFQSTPVHSSIRRQVIINWYEGMPDSLGIG